VPRRHRHTSGELPLPGGVRGGADVGLFEPAADPAPTKGRPAVFSRRPRESVRAGDPRKPRFPRAKSWR